MDSNQVATQMQRHIVNVRHSKLFNAFFQCGSVLKRCDYRIIKLPHCSRCRIYNKQTNQSTEEQISDIPPIQAGANRDRLDLAFALEFNNVFRWLEIPRR